MRECIEQGKWAELEKLIGAIADADSQQLDEVREASKEIDCMRVIVEADLVTGLESGRSQKTMGEKVQVITENSHYMPIIWDHSGLEVGVERLNEAVKFAQAFPKLRESGGLTAREHEGDGRQEERLSSRGRAVGARLGGVGHRVATVGRRLGLGRGARP